MSEKLKKVNAKLSIVGMLEFLKKAPLVPASVSLFIFFLNCGFVFLCEYNSTLKRITSENGAPLYLAIAIFMAAFAIAGFAFYWGIFNEPRPFAAIIVASIALLLNAALIVVGIIWLSSGGINTH